MHRMLKIFITTKTFMIFKRVVACICINMCELM
jgi:hypothetical protein